FLVLTSVAPGNSSATAHSAAAHGICLLLRNRQNPRAADLDADNSTVAARELAKIFSQKGPNDFRWIVRQPPVGHLSHFLVVFCLRMRVGMVAAVMATDVAVEIGANVP